jgi:hypothetical protein
MTIRGKNRLARTGVLLLACLTLCPNARPGRAEERSADVKLLQGAGIAANEPALLELFKKQTVTEGRARAIGALIEQLGDDTFLVREKATRELMAMGPVARTALLQATRSKDAEVAARARRCLKHIENGSQGELLACAARVLSARKSAKAVDVLLAFLPNAPAFGVEEDVIGAVRALAVSKGKAHPALVAALTDKEPLRRAVAAEALAGLPEYSEAVRKVLKDTEPSVRLRVSLALVCSGDRKVVPVLLDLLPNLTRDQAWQVDDVLQRLGTATPLLLPLVDQVAARKKHRDECLAWWKEHGAKANLKRLEGGPRRKAKLTARASHTWVAIHSPDKAIDGDRQTFWNAGTHPPPGGGAWIEVDVGAVRQLGGLLLVTSQLPDGPTVHEVWASSDPIGEVRTKARLVHTFKGHTRTNEVLRFEFPKRLSGRYVQIRTTHSPSWVGWVEIELGVR